MRTLVFDCTAGNHATRILAALLDVGADAEKLHGLLSSLPWTKGWQLEWERQPSGGLMGTCVRLSPVQHGIGETGYGYEHDHDWDLPEKAADDGVSVWGQLHEHGQLIEQLLPEWQLGFSPEQAVEACAPLSLSGKPKRQLEQMVDALSAMRQAQPAGEIRQHELLLMVGAIVLLESLEVQQVWTTPVCVAGDALSRVILSCVAQGRVPLPRLAPEGLSIGYGHDGRESTVPNVLRACLGDGTGLPT